MIAALLATTIGTPTPRTLVFCCEAQNDLFRATQPLAAATPWLIVKRFVNCSEAALTDDTTALLILADVAEKQPRIPRSVLDALATHTELKVLAELAAIETIAGLRSLDPAPCGVYERIVALPDSPLWSNAPAETKRTLRPLDLLEPGACTYIPYVACAAASGGAENAKLHLALAKVAGFDRAVFGLNDSGVVASTTAVLFEPAGYDRLMLSAVRLSAVAASRFAPVEAWTRLWRALLRWLLSTSATDIAEIDALLEGLAFEGLLKLQPSFAAGAALPQTASARAVARAMHWTHTASGLLASAEAEHTSRAFLLGGVTSVPIAMLPPLFLFGDPGVGNGSAGIFEAYLSRVQSGGDAAGTQPLGVRIRSDCVGEAAGALALGAWAAHADAKATLVSAALLDYLFFTSRAQRGARSEARSPLGGILLWGTNTPPPYRREVYADDQYRTLLMALFAGAAQNSSRWNVPLAKLLLGNARLQSEAGFSAWSGGDEALLLANGWRFYWRGNYTSSTYYYQAAAHASLLWAYVQLRRVLCWRRAPDYTLRQPLPHCAAPLSSYSYSTHIAVLSVALTTVHSIQKQVRSGGELVDLPRAHRDGAREHDGQVLRQDVEVPGGAHFGAEPPPPSPRVARPRARRRREPHVASRRRRRAPRVRRSQRSDSRESDVLGRGAVEPPPADVERGVRHGGEHAVADEKRLRRRPPVLVQLRAARDARGGGGDTSGGWSRPRALRRRRRALGRVRDSRAGARVRSRRVRRGHRRGHRRRMRAPRWARDAPGTRCSLRRPPRARHGAVPRRGVAQSV